MTWLVFNKYIFLCCFFVNNFVEPRKKKVQIFCVPYKTWFTDKMQQTKTGYKTKNAELSRILD